MGSCTNLGEHDGLIVRSTWQEREAVDGRILNFSVERIVCRKCGEQMFPKDEERKRQ